MTVEKETQNTIIDEDNMYRYLEKVIKKYNLRSKIRCDEYKFKRYAFFYYLYIKLDFSHEASCSLLNFKTHSSSMYGVRNHRALINDDTTYQSITKDIRDDLSRCPNKNGVSEFEDIVNKHFEIRTDTGEHAIEDVLKIRTYLTNNFAPEDFNKNLKS